MKTPVILIALLCASLAHAETYKWEDGKGVHFTDNPNAIPAKYRARALAAADEDITTANPEVAESIDTRKRLAAEREQQEEASATDVESRQIKEEARQARQAALKARKDANEKRFKEELAAKNPKNEYDNWRPSTHRQGYSPAKVKRK